MHIETKLVDGALWVEAPGVALSSTVDGGVRKVKGAVFRRVAKHMTCREMEEAAVPGYLNFYTAVDVAKHHWAARGRYAAVVATAGFGNTINVLVVVQAEPDLRALADVYRLAVEAKAVTAVDMGLRRGLARLGGDASDAVAVIATGGVKARYMGLGTEVGEEVYALVQEAVKKAAEPPDLDQELRRYLGVGVGDLLRLVLEAYRQAPVPGAQGVEETAADMLSRLLQDPNVWAFIYAAGELDAKAASGTHRGLSPQEHAQDSKKIVADEAIGAALAQYINGFKALQAMYWLDRRKPPPLDRLPMYTDDVAAALAGGLLSRLYDKLLHGI